MTLHFDLGLRSACVAMMVQSVIVPQQGIEETRVNDGDSILSLLVLMAVCPSLSRSTLWLGFLERLGLFRCNKHQASSDSSSSSSSTELPGL